jgi:hypothetical protein
MEIGWEGLSDIHRRQIRWVARLVDADDEAEALW